ncbi:hypothetical protein KIN20_025190 [Parelaphostrongylus tenuis]|uniref:Uncharacterized protein n=1 Tax=Parelaphostrongylus tenuis TaxID=148309 RepID=A0AAD5MY36_PARTN|nr:hypothetical protein KIN20_025190 [Parelaphostrongylus tenuis]
MKKIEQQPAHRGLPERWKELVFRLKKKLEALKVQKSLLSHTSTVSPTRKGAVTFLNFSDTNNTTADKPMEKSTRYPNDSVFSSQQQLSEGSIILGQKVNKVLNNSTVPVSKTRLTSSTQGIAKASEIPSDGISSKPRDMEEVADMRAQSQEFISSTSPRTTTILGKTSEFFSSLSSRAAENRLTELITSTVASAQIGTAATRNSTSNSFSSPKISSSDSSKMKTSTAAINELSQLSENEKKEIILKTFKTTLLDNMAESRLLKLENSPIREKVNIQSFQEHFSEEDRVIETPLSSAVNTTQAIIQYASANVTTKTTPNSKNSLNVSVTKKFAKLEIPVPNIVVTMATVPESTFTSNRFGDVESVGGFVISKVGAASDEISEPSDQRDALHGWCH